jgi:hypothetical protein
MFPRTGGRADINRLQLQGSEPLMPTWSPAGRNSQSARLLALVLAAALTGCASGGDGAVLGANPGGGFYCPHNRFIGCAYP